MTFQGILIGLIFAAAVFYVGKKVFAGFFHTPSTSGCEKCDLPDSVKSLTKTGRDAKRS